MMIRCFAIAIPVLALFSGCDEAPKTTAPSATAPAATAPAGNPSKGTATAPPAPTANEIKN